MKRIFPYILTALVLAACGRRECPFSGCGDSSDSVEITADILLPSTPVRNQGDTELCWIYAMLAAIETDRLAQGDSVTLSPLWLARKSLEEQSADTYLSGRRISLRGTLPEAMRLLETHGIVAWDAYRASQQSPSRAATRKTERLARSFSVHKKGLEELREAVGDALDSTLGPTPRNVFMLGMEYTPREFAHSLCMPGDWKAYTSFTHHPFHTPFVMEIPDNRQRHEATNIPLEELVSMTARSLRNGHPVAWEGSLAFRRNGNDAAGIQRETGISHGNLSRKDMTTLQQQRQRMLERHQLTDDHCMAITGMGHDRKGQRYFILKNSWGKDNGHDGYVYMTERQFALCTIMIMARI
ncbi:MAG: C1 family peptidase [Bacteroidales bacterium]|nr:C1 family peptidase [Bacteroidales bacterium]MCM1146598.1 C1 family peptidase [Bacteroidales bacterium]MCM1205990.1 C1 family peptidase [Bacillota bacterium]MCM1510129.1 C1 family peptidase [Clostridium sp.]